MTEVPTIARMPGGYQDPTAADFEPGVVKGLRDAGLVLLVTAGLQIGLMAFGVTPSYTVIIDVFLGIQLYRLRHSWKLWALVRAWAGVALAALALVTAGVSVPVALVVGAQVAYSASLILFLTGIPSARTLLGGRLCFVLSAVLLVGVVVWRAA